MRTETRLSLLLGAIILALWAALIIWLALGGVA